jgi:Mg-chelatase subunit ChlI
MTGIKAAFLAEWHDDDMALRARIVEARGALARVDADDAILRDCASSASRSVRTVCAGN